ncbi:MAG: hypothetical protein ACTSRK_03755 [Promethearchaeota archaeon]
MKGSIDSEFQPVHNFIEDHQTGYRVCTHCGLIEEGIILFQGFPYSQNSKEIISKKSTSFQQSVASSNLKRAMKLDRIVPWSEKKTQMGFFEIKRLASVHGLSNCVVERAQYLFEKMIKHSRFKTHFIDLMAQVALYYASKENGSPYVLENLTDNGKYSVSLAQRYYYLLLTTFKLTNPPPQISSFINHYGTRLRLDSTLIQNANSIVSNYLNFRNTSGCDIRGIAAGVLYFTCVTNHIPLSQRQLSSIAGISEITIRSRFKEIRKYCLR